MHYVWALPDVWAHGDATSHHLESAVHEESAGASPPEDQEGEIKDGHAADH